MAHAKGKSKKTKGKTPSRSGKRRMGAVHHHNALVNDAWEMGGLLVAAIGLPVIQKRIEHIPGMVVGGGEVIGGFFLKRHFNHPFATGLGYGAISIGTVTLAHDFGVIKGLDDMVSGVGNEHMLEEGDYVHGIRNNQHIAGIRNNQHVGTMEEDGMPANTGRKSLADIFHADGLWQG